MPDFERSIDVQAPKQKVVDYVSKVENMPHYLPTVKEAHMQDAEHVHMEVEFQGKHHEDSGYLHTGGDQLSWGSEDHDYHGEMLFNEQNGITTVTIQLHMSPPADSGSANGTEWNSRIEKGLAGALQSIKQQVEGTGGKREIA